jgi:hypothetical protein
MSTRPVLCLAALALFLSSCGSSDEATAPPADRIAPQVRLLFPFSRAPLDTGVADSTDVYVAACDSAPAGSSGGIARVELYYLLPDATEPARIGDTMSLTSLAAVADSSLRSSLDVPLGWSLYTQRWYTGPTPLPPVGTPIVTGTRLHLFAVATDLAANQGWVPDSLHVRVTNRDDFGNHGAPMFVVYPPRGRVDEELRFDPRGTTDPIDTNAEIRVRWDFDGNLANGWDIDWEADARADQVVRYVYYEAGRYQVLMDARNADWPGRPGGEARFTRPVIVDP